MPPETYCHQHRSGAKLESRKADRRLRGDPGLDWRLDEFGNLAGKCGWFVRSVSLILLEVQLIAINLSPVPEVGLCLNHRRLGTRLALCRRDEENICVSCRFKFASSPNFAEFRVTARIIRLPSSQAKQVQQAKQGKRKHRVRARVAAASRCRQERIRCSLT